MRNRKWERLKSWSMYILLLSLTEKLRDININRDRLDLAKQKVEGHLKSVSDKVAGSEEKCRQKKIGTCLLDNICPAPPISLSSHVCLIFSQHRE